MKHYDKRNGIITRECSSCGGDLGDRYGKQRYCKSCHAAHMRATRPRHKDLPDDARRKANVRALSRHYVKTGKIIQTPCVKCGDPNSQRHHPDYDKPLEVIWLCRKHHLELHAEKSETSSVVGTGLQ